MKQNNSNTPEFILEDYNFKLDVDMKENEENNSIDYNINSFSFNSIIKNSNNSLFSFKEKIIINPQNQLNNENNNFLVGNEIKYFYGSALNKNSKFINNLNKNDNLFVNFDGNKIAYSDILNYNKHENSSISSCQGNLRYNFKDDKIEMNKLQDNLKKIPLNNYNYNDNNDINLDKVNFTPMDNFEIVMEKIIREDCCKNNLKICIIF
jgi:hypothetical protein